MSVFSLANQTLGPYRLRVEKIGREKFFDQFNFGIYLLDARGNASDAPVFRGLYNAGRPSIHVGGWIDGEFVENARVASRTVNPSADSLAEPLAQKLGALIPPGGRLWFAYESYSGEGELMRETRAGLAANFPLLATPLGFLLYRADCWLGLKNWDFPEGGREGPMKLQGNKAMNAAHARERARASVAELQNFLARRAVADVAARAQDRAKIILPKLKSII